MASGMTGYINLETPACGVTQGMELSFRAPCGCSDVSGISLDNQFYSIVDASGSPLTGCSGYFEAGAILTVIIDVTNRTATLLNPRVNTYTQSLGTENDEPSPTAKTVWARVKNAEQKMTEVEELTKAIQRPKMYGNYKTMVNSLTGSLSPILRPGETTYDATNALPAGTPIYISNKAYPDLWIYCVHTNESMADKGIWEYTNDDAIFNLLRENARVQIGCYDLWLYKTPIDEDTLSQFAKKTELTNGSIEVKKAEYASEATKAACDSLNNNIANTYAKKNDLGVYAKTTDLQPYAKTVDFAGSLGDYDESKGTIEARLSALGFKEGTLQLTDNRTGTQTGKLYRQNKLVAVDKTITLSSGETRVPDYQSKLLFATVVGNDFTSSVTKQFGCIGQLGAYPNVVEYPIWVELSGNNLYVYQNTGKTMLCDTFIFDFAYEVKS